MWLCNCISSLRQLQALLPNHSMTPGSAFPQSQTNKIRGISGVQSCYKTWSTSPQDQLSPRFMSPGLISHVEARGFGRRPRGRWVQKRRAAYTFCDVYVHNMTNFVSPWVVGNVFSADTFGPTVKCGLQIAFTLKWFMDLGFVWRTGRWCCLAAFLMTFGVRTVERAHFLIDGHVSDANLLKIAESPRMSLSLTSQPMVFMLWLSIVGIYTCLRQFSYWWHMQGRPPRYSLVYLNNTQTHQLM